MIRLSARRAATIPAVLLSLAGSAAGYYAAGHRRAAPSSVSRTRSGLRAGLRDFVGPYDDDLDARSPGERRSPGFIGFSNNRDYPGYDGVIDTTARRSPTNRISDGSGTRRIRDKYVDRPSS